MTQVDTGTGASARPFTEYASPAPSQTRAPSVRADYDRLRTAVDALAGEVHEAHGEVLKDDLTDRTVEKSKKSVPQLLDELTAERGMGWSDIAEVVGVSVSAVRKWRKGGSASPQSRWKLARIATFLDVLEEKLLVEDPAAWMEMEFSLEPGYCIRPIDLYLEGHVTGLIELADQRLTTAEILDRVRPNWRQNRSQHEVYVDSTGERAIRLREN